MPLPKITAPSYEVSLPSSGKTIKYRPFLVKEEKVLMLASESNNPKDIVNGLKHFIKTYEFVNKDEINPEPIRKQKRND